MTVERAKAVAQGTVPWAAVALAVLGWLDARSEAGDAQSAVHTKTEESQRWTDERADKAWRLVKYVLEDHEEQLEHLHQYAHDLNAALDEALEMLDEGRPSSRRERRARADRIGELRDLGPSASHARKRAPPLPDDYDAVQTHAFDLDDPLGGFE